MKRILTLTAIAAASLLAFSCKSEPATPKPIVEFGQQAYTIYSGGETDIDVVLSEVASSDVTIAVTFGGDAVKDTDYSVSEESVIIKAGQNTGSITVSDISLSTEKSLSVTLSAAPEGYQLGTKTVAFVTVDNQEALLFSFETPENVILESYISTLTISGTRTNDFKPETDITIPLKISGAGAAEVEVPSSVTIKAGENKASITIKPGKETYDEDLPVTLTVDTDAAPRFNQGEIGEQLLTLRGLQTPDKLAGEWQLVRMLDSEEIKVWFEEYSEGEDDLDLLPLNNEGLTLTFSTAGEGVGTVVAGGNGTHDFEKYLSATTFTLAEPAAEPRCASVVQLGKYTLQENNMFVGEDYADKGGAYLVYTYYTLKSVFINFDGDTNATSSAQIAIALSPDGKEMVIQLRNYSLENAPFGEFTHMMCDYEFEPEICSFPMLLKKL